MSNIANVLTIAGSDSGGGAGIQADLKSFSANGVFGASVITALTAQNTKGVTGIHDAPPEFIAAQLEAVFSDIDFSAVKVGMLSQIPVIETVADGLARHSARNIVFDPVMVATSGDLLLAEDAIGAIKSRMLPACDLLTPNLHEAAKLTNTALATSKEAMMQQAELLLEMGAKAVLIKGGHGSAEECADLLLSKQENEWFSSRRVDTQNTHGTGCSLSSAIAANLARGSSTKDAVKSAKEWITGAIEASDQLTVGTGSGPVHHFHNLW